MKKGAETELSFKGQAWAQNTRQREDEAMRLCAEAGNNSRPPNVGLEPHGHKVKSFAISRLS